MIRRPPRSTLFPTRRSSDLAFPDGVLWATLGERPTPADLLGHVRDLIQALCRERPDFAGMEAAASHLDRKSTRLNSSHANISYAVFCLKKKNISFPTSATVT